MSSDIEFYLDSNIIIAYYFQEDDNNQHERILECLEKISLKKDISLIASRWTMAETEIGIIKKTREMIKQKKIEGKSADYITREATNFTKNLRDIPRLGNVNFKIRKIKKRVTAESFLKMIDRISSLGNLTDALHCVIMNIFEIKYILTFNDKDFRIFEENIPDIEAVNPDKIDKYIDKAPIKKAEGRKIKKMERRETDSTCDVERHTANDY